MDHHDDWAHWSDEPADLPDADTADLGGDPLGDLGHHDGLDHGLEDTADHPGDEPADDYAHPAEPAPDLLHDGGEEYLGEAHDDPWPAEHAPDPHDVPDPHGGYAADEAPFGDPDLGAEHDPGWHGDEFPPPLEFDHAAPEPVDGYPWSDPATLGEPAAVDVADGPDHYGVAGAAHPDDLFAYAGTTPPAGDPWAALLGSDDPATSALARWWAPPH